MFISLIHFEFIFVYGVRKCSSFILLQVVDQFSQHHLLKRRGGTFLNGGERVSSLMSGVEHSSEIHGGWFWPSSLCGMVFFELPQWWDGRMRGNRSAWTYWLFFLFPSHRSSCLPNLAVFSQTLITRPHLQCSHSAPLSQARKSWCIFNCLDFFGNSLCDDF